MRKILIVLILVACVGLGYRLGARAVESPIDADVHVLSVPVVVTPSLQLASGQVILYKATNVSEGPVNFRLMVYTDDNGIPAFYKDFSKVPGGKTVTYVYQPPVSTVAIGEAAVEAPQAVRATFAPIPREDHNAIRRIVANVQIMRLQNGANGASTLDTPIVVPLSHCNFEPRGIIPYTGGTWYWNCAPDMYPLKRLRG
jgi:hypothetical protein